MSPEDRPRWTSALADAVPVLLLAPWFAVVSRLMVVDVWDETRALAGAAGGFGGALAGLHLSSSPGAGTVLFRPIPALIFSAASHAIADPEVLWRVLRWLAAAMVAASALILVQVVRRFRGQDPGRDALLTVLILFSGSALIAASWFANLFDACALLFVTCGIWLLGRGRALLAGLVLAAAFFCKEVAVLALPVVAVLEPTGSVPRRQTRLALAVAVAGGCCYLLLRTLVVAPGSARDVHSLHPLSALQTLLRLVDAWWWETTRVPVIGVGAALLLVTLVMIRSRAVVAGMAALLVLSAILYAGMLGPSTAPLLGAATFSGRLFLVPVVLSLLLLALDGPRWLPLLVLPVVLWGAAVTFDHHLRLQRAYERVYQLGEDAHDVVAVDAPSHRRPFLDLRHGVRLGPFPDADWRLDPNGELHRRSGDGNAVSGAGS